MAAAVVLLVFALAVRALGGGRAALVKAAVVLGAFTAVITELLSVFHAVRFEAIFIAWSALAAFLLCRVPCARLCVRMPDLATSNMQTKSREHGNWMIWLIAAVVFVVLAVTFYLAIVYPPNNWDVILYHLPRQVQWLQQQSVAHFPTQDYRLTVNPPLMEYGGLHLMILSGGDRLNSLIGWAGFALTLVAVSLLGKQLGADSFGQWLAAAVAATVPIAIHESTAGKNDILVALWAVSAAWLYFQGSRYYLGLSTGLLMLTKGTGAVLVLPLMMLIVLDAFHAPLRKATASRLSIIAVCVLVLNGPHWYRNYACYGSIHGQTFGLDNARHDPAAVASNLLRNFTMHLATESPKRNAKIERFVQQQHAALQIASNDRDTTWGYCEFKLDYAPEKEHATAPLHLLLILTVLITFQNWRMSFLLISSALLFCVLFKWQVWHPRLHLPWLMLGSAGVGVMLSKSKTLTIIIFAALAWLAWPALVRSENRPLAWSVDADRARFLNRDDIRQDAETLAALTKNDHTIAIINHGAFPWEYPLTVRLKSAHNRLTYFYPVKGSPPAGTPDAVIAVDDHPGPAFIRHASGAVYERSRVIGLFTYYRPATMVPDDAELDHAIGRFGIGAEAPERKSP